METQEKDTAATAGTVPMTMIQALRSGLDVMMERDDDVVIAAHHHVQTRAQRLDHGHGDAALDLVVFCHGLDPHLLALPAQMLRHVFVHIVEHGRGAGHAAIEQRAVALLSLIHI